MCRFGFGQNQVSVLQCRLVLVQALPHALPNLIPNVLVQQAEALCAGLPSFMHDIWSGEGPANIYFTTTLKKIEFE